jgi:acyl carrier protein
MTPEDVMSRVFGVERSRLDDASSSKTLPEWDSLAHMTLVLELETAYGVTLSVEDVLAMTDVASLRRILTSRGAAW